MSKKPHDTHSLPTRFAPAERESREVVSRQRQSLRDTARECHYDVVQAIVLILNSRRQIVYANKGFLDVAGVDSIDDLLGLRPGEALDCIHSRQTIGGCGTTEFCSQCGAVKAILRGLDGAHGYDECRILRNTPCGQEGLDLLVSASPLDIEGERFSVCSILDISHEKRRLALERIFFHDILDTAGGLKGLLNLFAQSLPDHLADMARLIDMSISHLLDEIASQKQLLSAEHNDLALSVTPLTSRQVLEKVSATYENTPLAKDKAISVTPDSPDLDFESDFTLLRRVLGNMLKNGLEASDPGQTVTMSCASDSGSILFQVHNPAVMPPEVQLQIFKRSFSTKGDGRGLGTYSIKLLSERYLGGHVSFTSSEGQGTTFMLRLPLKPGQPDV